MLVLLHHKQLSCITYTIQLKKFNAYTTCGKKKAFYCVKLKSIDGNERFCLP